MKSDNTITQRLIRIVGSPFIGEKQDISIEDLEDIYNHAFKNRVALLYLSIHKKEDWPPGLIEKYNFLNTRRDKTLDVVADLSETLNKFDINQYAIFKSLKPYPATPNDTDIINFGDKKKFKEVIGFLYKNGYEFHEWAPMQTTLIHPWGIGKTGKGKIGGTYYIDLYSNISTDYFQYLDKRSLIPNVETRVLNGKKIQNIKKEIELAIILFHNVFPERTFQLEHFYMPLYHLKDESFDIILFITFVESQKLTRAIKTNLTVVEYIHNELFGFVPSQILSLLERWGRNKYELRRLKKRGITTPFMISSKTFWLTFYDKLYDTSTLKSFFIQLIHMLNPMFFIDVLRSLKNRFSEKGTYHAE